jgi:diaminopimelate epimerase
MHGTGNVILIVDQQENGTAAPGADRIKELGDAASGPGFDQMMWLGPADNQDCLASYRVFNADGSEVGQCGNGARCVAKYLLQDDPQIKHCLLQSPAGLIEAQLHADGRVSVCMGTPEFTPSAVPFSASASSGEYLLEVDGASFNVSVLSMGNPHCVLRVDDVGAAPVGELGPKIESHTRFPKRTNVGFMQVRDRRTIALRVHERGVGETLACGTGACAAVVAGINLGALESQVCVQLPGGEVVVSWRGGKDPVWLKGNAETVNDGTIEL